MIGLFVPSANSKPPTRQQALLMTRIIWSAMMAGQLMFFAVVNFVILPQVHRDPSHQQPMLTWIAAGLTASIVPVSMLVRLTIFKKASVNGQVAIRSFVLGNIIFWANSEGAAFFSLIVAVVNGALWPTAMFAGGALALQAITFPTGSNLAESDAEK